MADPTRPLWQWSACELAEAIAARKVTAVEAVGAAVTRMRATNGKINAVVIVHDGVDLACAPPMARSTPS